MGAAFVFWHEVRQQRRRLLAATCDELNWLMSIVLVMTMMKMTLVFESHHAVRMARRCLQKLAPNVHQNRDTAVHGKMIYSYTTIVVQLLAATIKATSD